MTSELPHSPAAQAEVPNDGPARPEASDRAPGPWQPSPERILLAILLALAALVRFVGPDQVEPNVSVVEAAHLASVEALLLGHGPGLVGLDEAGASGLALSPPALLRALGREPELATRLYAALGSLALVAAFYGLCRQRYGLLVSLAASALLAFSPWSIFFGRNGELNAFVALAAIAGVWLQRRTPLAGSLTGWLVSGTVTGLAVYWHPSAIWLVPALLLAGASRLVEPRTPRDRLGFALAVFAVTATVVALPDLLALAPRGGLLAPGLADETGGGVASATPPTVRGALQQAARGFLLLDPTLPGNTRYLPAGRAPLDGLTGVLLLIGLGLAAWHPAGHLEALALFLVPLFGSQLGSAAVPDPGRAVVAWPGLYLLVALAIDRLLAGMPFRPVTSAVVLVAIPAYAVVSWQSYAGWMGAAQTAQARQPAIDYDEVDAWLAEQRDRITAGQPIASAADWRQQHPRLSTGARTVRRPRGAGSVQAVAPASLRLEQMQVVQGDRESRSPRGVTITPSGDVLVADQAGRVSRLDADRNVLTPLPGPSPAWQQVSEIVAGSDGQLYLADAERSLLARVDERGAVVGTLGADWGMYRPRGMTVGPDGTLYVADTGRNRIVVATGDGRLIKSIGPRTSGGDLDQPTDVAVDPSGRIYVIMPDQGRLSVLDDEGQVLGGWPISKADTIDGPHIAVVTDGAIAITDPGQHRVWLADADGREIDSVQTGGRPYGVAADVGRLVVTDLASGRLLVFALQSR